MADTVATTDKSKVKNFLKSADVQKSIKDTLGAKSSQFTASLLSLVGNDTLLAQAEPASLFSAALTAASLDLPINKNLGFAHIIGYKNNKKGGIVEAQFQIGWKGFVQLAQRTGQYKKINATPVYEGQLIDQDPLAGNTYDWKAKPSNKVIGYVSRFTLVTGFESELYMSVDEVKKHGKQYSQAFKKNYGPWVENFDAMALKTVIKLNISKYGPMSTELQKALTTDQAVIRGEDADYPDGVDLGDVRADDDQKKAIIAANTPEGETVDDEDDHESDDDDEPETPPAKPAKPAPKPAAKSVKERAADFVAKGKAANAEKNGNKQASLVDDDNDTSA